MSYLVMECHPAYAVVLDNEGRYIKAANLNYETGQTISTIIQMRESGKSAGVRAKIAPLASMAACLCLILFCTWQFILTPYGTVRMQINPDIVMSVNRMDYVIGLEGKNEDGKRLLDGYRYRHKKVEQVADELADRAVELAYLTDGGDIYLIFDSKHEKWKLNMEDRMLTELEVHFQGKVKVTVGEKPRAASVPASEKNTETTKPSSQKTGDIQTTPQQSSENQQRPTPQGTSGNHNYEDDKDEDDMDEDDQEDQDDDNDDAKDELEDQNDAEESDEDTKSDGQDGEFENDADDQDDEIEDDADNQDDEFENDADENDDSNDSDNISVTENSLDDDDDSDDDELENDVDLDED